LYCHLILFYKVPKQNLNKDRDLLPQFHIIIVKTFLDTKLLICN